MSVHYKFKSTLNFDTIAFDGLHISVADLKKAIVSQKRLGKMSDFDLQITNAQTKEEYFDDSTLIPKNTSLIIARIPLAQQPKRSWDIAVEKPHQPRLRTKQDNSISLDISKMQGSEEEKIREMMLQSTADYDPKSYQRTKGHYQSGEVPVTYRCNKCKKGGHWIKNCPLGSLKDHTEVKRTTGIPRSFRDKDPLQTQETVELPPIAETKTTIPEDLLCSICNDLFTDAVMIPCCGSSFCDDCVRTALLESEDNECPDCGEKGSSPGALIPNRFIRNSVNSFKNETGYTNTTLKKADKEKPEIVSGGGAASAVVSSTVENADKTEEKENADAVEDEKEAPIKNTEEENSIEPTQTPTSAADDAVAEKPDDNAETENKESVIDAGGTEEIKESTPTAKSSIAVTSTSVKDDILPPGEVESDFEDNIVVTMPLAQVENQHAVFRERPYNDRRGGGHPAAVKSVDQEMMQKIPKISPINMNSELSYGTPPLLQRNNEWDRKYDQHSGYKEPNKELQNLNQIGCITTYPNPNTKPPMHMMPNYSYCDMGQRPPIRPLMVHDMLPDGLNRGGNMYAQHNRMIQGQGPPPPVHGPPIGPYQNPYGQMMPNRPTVGYNQFMPPDVRNDCMGYGPPPRGNSMANENSMSITSSNLASVYQGVAEKVGTGIIDDPLEAFNRIMKEKEKRKEARCRSSERHQSRSNDHHHHHPPRNRFRTSPYDYDKPSREQHYTKDRKERSPIERERERERRGDRDRDHRRGGGGGDYGRGNNERKLEKNYTSRRRHSNSFSDKSTRSRSRSNSLSKKHSISPHKSRSRGYKKTSDDKYHRSEKSRNESRTQNSRPVKETTSPPPAAAQAKSSYDSMALEYQQQPTPPGIEVNIAMVAPVNSHTWTIGKRDGNDQELSSSSRRRDLTPPRVQHNKRVMQSSPKVSSSDRKRMPSRSASPNDVSSSVMKHEKRESHRENETNDEITDGRNNNSNNGTQKLRVENRVDREKRSNSVESRSKGVSAKAAPADSNLPQYKSEKFDDDWQLMNDSDRISVDSKRDPKREKSESSKRDKKVKERKKRRKEKTQRKKTKKDKREKHESASDREKSGKDSKKVSSKYTPERDGDDVRRAHVDYVSIDARATEATNGKGDKIDTAATKSTFDVLCDGQSTFNNPEESFDDANVHEQKSSSSSSSSANGQSDCNKMEEANSRKEREHYDGSIEPELSKWERDEVNINATTTTATPGMSQRKDDNLCKQNNNNNDGDDDDDDNNGKTTTAPTTTTITNEVLRKAENVIFAKSERESIRPLEAPPKKSERTGSGSTASLSKGRSSPKPNIGGNLIENIQITVPLSDDHLRKRRSRSTELSNNPTASIKERLGSKIVTNNAFSLKSSSGNGSGSGSHKRQNSMDGGETEERRYRNKFRDPRTPRRDVVRDRGRGGGGGGGGVIGDVKSSAISSQQPSGSSAGSNRRTNKRNAFASGPFDDNNKRKLSRDDSRGRDRLNSRDTDRKSRERSYGGAATHKTSSNSNNNSSSTKKDTPKRVDDSCRGGSKFDRYNRYNSTDDKHKKSERQQQKHSPEHSHRISDEKRGFNMTDKASVSAGSSCSDSDTKSPDNKRKKKHKSKKDKKRVKRSSSVDSYIGRSSSKSNRSRKKMKSNRKNKKNKK